MSRISNSAPEINSRDIGKARIFRSAARDKPYTMLCNAMLRDSGLSLDAKGLLGFILSHPVHFEFSLAQICRATGIGRDRARRIIGELREHGYCGRYRERRPDGTWGPFEYLFSDEPDTLPKEPGPTTDGGPVTGNPLVANPTPSKECKTKRRNESKREDAQARPTAEVASTDHLQPSKDRRKARKADLLGERPPKAPRSTKVPFPDELAEPLFEYGLQIGMTEEDARVSVINLKLDSDAKDRRLPNWMPYGQKWLLGDLQRKREGANGGRGGRRESWDDIANAAFSEMGEGH